METERIKVLVFGVVQGVCFRAYTQEEATALGLVGSVRNLPDGSVEVIAEGEKERLEKLINWLRKGPSFAQVKDINITRESSSGVFKEFRIAYYG